MTELVVGRSGEDALGVDGGGVAISPRSESWATLQLGKTIQAAAMAAETKTLMLTPTLPLLLFLETVCAVDRNAVLVVIAQEYVGVLGCALITDTERDVGC